MSRVDTYEYCVNHEPFWILLVGFLNKVTLLAGGGSLWVGIIHRVIVGVRTVWRNEVESEASG